MNYFELFNIPVQLKVDVKALNKTFFSLSRLYHPDFYTQGTQAEQEEALEKTALLNQAWKTFQRPDETIAYVLQLKGLLEPEEKYNLDPDFLMEVMEINEAISENNPSLKATQLDRLAEMESSIYEPVKTIIENYRDQPTDDGKLQLVKAYYFQKKYLDRIRQSIPR